MQRREAREFVLSALYQREFGSVDFPSLLEGQKIGDQGHYIQSTFQGILDHQREIDEMIGERTVGWRFERLALIDRNILRIGVYELLYGEDVPPQVAMDEAVELSKKFGTDNARSFVNGILDRIWNDAGRPRDGSPATA
jgi:N utilization substance protein B